jgi:hypothetical protein
LSGPGLLSLLSLLRQRQEYEEGKKHTYSAEKPEELREISLFHLAQVFRIRA